MVLRDLLPADRQPIHALLRATQAFTAEEVTVALELVDEGLAGGEASGYHFVVGAIRDQVLGYACFGPTPLTEGVFDLYWIAVSPETQGRGVGRKLLLGVDVAVRARGGRMLLIETAGKPEYQKTRAFYERAGCDLVARVPDFYRVGDDKLIYARRV